MSFPDLGRMVLEITVSHRLGDRAAYFDVPGVVDTIVERLRFGDMDEIDPAVFEEILDQNRRSL